MRDRITVYRRTETNSGGAVTYSLDAIEPRRIPSSVTSPTGQRMERLFSGHVISQQTLTVSYRSGIDVRIQDVIEWHETPTRNTRMEVVGLATTGQRREWTTALCEVRS